MSQAGTSVGLRASLRTAFIEQAAAIICVTLVAIVVGVVVASAWLPELGVGRLLLLMGVPPALLSMAIIALARTQLRRQQHAVAPLLWLSREVGRWDAKDPDFKALAPDRVPSHVDGEALLLAQTIHGFARRASEFVERERNFTRDASHELRTPLTVIKMASQVLISDSVLDPFATRNVERIQRSARDMEALIEAFLLIAREADNALPADDFAINSVVRDELARAEALVGDRKIELQLVERAQFRLHAPSKVVAVMIGNLIRNAVTFCDSGHVRVTIDDDEVVIEDSGIGMAESDLEMIFQPFFRAQHGRRGGHGVGLTIVKRLSDRYHWPVAYESVEGKGTTVRVRFPERVPVGKSAPAEPASQAA